MHRTVFIKTTEACQLNCKHCFTTGNKPPRDYIDGLKIGGWIKRFAEHNRNDSLHFEFHGGEPFLAPPSLLHRITSQIRFHSPNASVGATTNLTYALTDELLDFMVTKLDSLGTSWDKGIRFANDKQEQLWRDNLAKVIAAGKQVTLNVSVTRAVVEMDQEELLKFLRDTGCFRVQFERITANGNANNHLSLFPSNAEINQWYLRLHEASEKLNARNWFYNVALESVYSKFEKGVACSGTFCRNCEESIFTVNANGSIAGCPNGAAEEQYGHIDQSIEELLRSNGRLDLMVKEKTQNTSCFGCPVYAYCGGDCHRLAWDGDVCASPKQLMLKLAGLDYVQLEPKKKRFIPIARI